MLVEAAQEVSSHGSPVHQVSGLGHQGGACYGQALFSRVGRGWGVLVVINWGRNMDWIVFVVVDRSRRWRRRRMLMLMVDRSVVVWLVVLWFV